ncbi:MAG TPA: ABC transporter permease [Lacunisphaera sp.]|jgi:predicted permease
MKHALRSLARTPGFTAIAILTLALGIGLNTAMFSLINSLLLQPLKFPESQNLYVLQRSTAQQTGSHAPAAVEEIKRGSAGFAQLAVYRNWAFTLSEPHRPAEVVPSHRVSANYFEILGIKPELGRSFLPDEEQPGHNAVVILSHAFWLSRFNGDPTVIGRTLRLDGTGVEVVGVLPASASAPTIFGPMSMFRPLGLTNEEKTNWTDNSYNLIGRYRPDLTPEQTKVRFASLAARLAADHPKEIAGSGLRIASLQSSAMDETSRHITFMLLALSGFVLLIACANLANLLIARAVSRAREFAIRTALGASRSQLIKPLAVECAMLALMGGGLGILVSMWTSEWISHRLAGDGPAQSFALDWRVLGFAFVVSLLTGLFFGVAPAWLVSRVRVNETLKSGTRGSTGDRSHHRLRQALIAGQFALALVLLAGAAFFVRGVNRLVHGEAGWNPAPLLRGNLSLPAPQYPTADRQMAFYDTLLQRLAALPGVESVAISYDLPLFGFPSQRNYTVEGDTPPVTGHEPTAMVNGVTPDYFKTTGTHLLRGRPFVAADRIGAPRVVIINEAMAHALFPNGDAVGRRLAPIGDQNPQPLEIVGVVEDVHFLNLSPSPVRFQLYQPFAQEPWGWVAVTIRAAGGTGRLIEPFRRIVSNLDSDIPVLDLLPVPALIARNTDDLKLINQLLVGFATLGLFLAALGIYSVIARLVVQRTSEIGIRMALGAQIRDVLRLIVTAGLRMALVGAGVGLIGAIALARFLSSATPAIATNGTMDIAGATIALLMVALVACYLPARRATKIDPTIALRAE